MAAMGKLRNLVALSREGGCWVVEPSFKGLGLRFGVGTRRSVLSKAEGIERARFNKIGGEVKEKKMEKESLPYDMIRERNKSYDSLPDHIKAPFSKFRRSLVALAVTIHDSVGRCFDSYSTGSIVSSDGKTILTFARFLAEDTCEDIPTILGAYEVRVICEARRLLYARPVYVDFTSDIAILRINASKPFPFPMAKIGSAYLQLEDKMLYSYGDMMDRLDFTPRTCTVKCVGCNMSSNLGGTIHFHTDCETPGAFLFNFDGELVGLNTAHHCVNAAGHDLKFVLPAEPLAEVILEKSKLDGNGDLGNVVVRPRVSLF